VTTRFLQFVRAYSKLYAGYSRIQNGRQNKMKKINFKQLVAALSLLAVFVLWTAALCFIDVQQIGPNNSSVGLSSLNQYIHGLTGVHMSLYVITDWLGLVPVGFAMGFALLGLMQWIRRRSIWKVDFSILILGGFYIVVFALYTLFEALVINHRPVLIDGFLEASYPSSTTMLVLCIMPTAVIQLKCRIKNIVLRRCAAYVVGIFTAFMVIARLISGVHWFSDIIGGVLLSTGLVMMYSALSGTRK